MSQTPFEILQDRLSITLNVAPDLDQLIRSKHANSYVLNEAGKMIGLHLTEGIAATLILDEVYQDLEVFKVKTEQLSQLDFQADLPQLYRWDMSECNLQGFTLPKGFAKLHILILHHNPLEVFELQGQVPSLEIIDVSHSRLQNISLGQEHITLGYFYAYKCQLDSFTAEHDLPNMQVLELRENPLTQLELPLCPRMERLDVSGLQLENIPPDLILEKLPMLMDLRLQGNPIQNIPREVFDKDENVFEAVLNYLKSVAIEGETDYLHQAKMILIGNGFVGKSSIRTKLLNKTAPLPKPEDRTPGLDISEYPVEDLAIEPLEEPIDFSLRIWDFGGQGKYREVQQLFCSRKSLYIFVTSPDDLPENEDYIGWQFWLMMAKTFGYDKLTAQYSPVIHVINKIDENSDFYVDNNTIIRLFPNVSKFVRISSRDLINFQQLEEAIRETLPQVGQGIFTDRYNKKWFELKVWLESKIQRNYIEFTKYIDVAINRYGLSEEDAKQWIDILDQIGTVIYFREHPKLRKYIVLNPLWVNYSVHKVLDTKIIREGVLYREVFPEIWNVYFQKPNPNDPDLTTETAYQDVDYEILISLMKSYKLCYESVDLHEKECFVVPALFSQVAPKLPEKFSEFEYHFQLGFDPFILAGTVNKLIVDLREKIHEPYKWKNSVILEHTYPHGTTAYALIEEDWENNRIEVKLKWDLEARLLGHIYHTLVGLNNEWKATKLFEKLDIEIFALHEGEFHKLKNLLKFKVPRFSRFHNIYNLIHRGLTQDGLDLPIDSEFHSKKIMSMYARKELFDYIFNHYTEDEFKQLVDLNDEFEGVAGNITTGMSQNQKVMALLDYCKRNVMMDTLIAILQKDKPTVFQKILGGQKVEDPPQKPEPSPFGKMDPDDRRLNDLKQALSDAITLLGQWRQTHLLSSDPRKKLEAKKNMEELEEQIKEYENQLKDLS